MLRFSFVILIAISGCSSKPSIPTIATERADKPARERHREFLRISKSTQVDTLFLGDSITHFWEWHGKPVWDARASKWKSVNFGISSDRIENLLWRITEGGELAGLNPHRIVLMIGTNNTDRCSAEQIEEGIRLLIKEIQSRCASARIVLMGLLPRSAKEFAEIQTSDRLKKEELSASINLINIRISAIANGDKIVYLDISSRLLDRDGSLSKEKMHDFLHLSEEGYRIWADALDEIWNK